MLVVQRTRALCPTPGFYAVRGSSMCKSERCTFVPNTAGTPSQDVSSNALMTFLLLSVPAYVANVQLEKVAGGAC